MKSLCLFTNEFPYGSWEAYLETEVKYYDMFDKVYVFSLQLRKEHAKTMRTLPENFEVFPIWYAPRWVYLFNSIRVLADKNLYREIKNIRQNGKVTFGKLIDLFVFLSRADYEARRIIKSVDKSKIKDAVFYSYRFEYQPYVAVLLRKKYGLNNRIVSRAHRYDLYEQFRAHEYIPCRKILLEELEAVYPCSQDGTKYLQQKYLKYVSKISTKFLGTEAHKTPKYQKNKVWHIVSCSNVVAVKRINLIVEALMRIKEINIVWTHFGDGPMLDEIKHLSNNLPSNIRADFRGSIKNSELLQIYETEQFDLFLNVSDSEGIPVSIMEAMSFGIPCIATDVGGTKEIISADIGTLLKRCFELQDLVDAILFYYNMTETEILKMRSLVKARWNEKFNAKNNYEAFVTGVLLK